MCVEPPSWQSERSLHVVTLRSNGTRTVFIRNTILINMILTLTRNKIRLHFKLRYVFTMSTVYSVCARVCVFFLPIIGEISHRALVKCIFPTAGTNEPRNGHMNPRLYTNKRIVVILTNGLILGRK